MTSAEEREQATRPAERAARPHDPVSRQELARHSALRSIELIATGDRADFDAVIDADAVNHESINEPLACRTHGPDGFHATALWLRGAFADLAHTIEHVVVDDDIVVVDTTMSGRHTGPFVLCDPSGAVDAVWAPTGKSFSARQSHWFRMREGLVTEHWAVRDDLAQGAQLGWMPPGPLYLLRCARARRQVSRDQRTSSPRS